MVEKTSKKTECGAKKVSRKKTSLAARPTRKDADKNRGKAHGKGLSTEKSAQIKNSVHGKNKPVKWPVGLAWTSYILMAIFMLILGPGALIIYAMAGGDDLLLQFLTYGVSGTAGVLCLIGLILGAVAAVQAYRKAGDRMREVMTLVAGGVAALGVSLLITVLLPFKAMESYVIMYTLLALLPGVLAAMFRWFLPARTERRNLQLWSLVITMVLLVIEVVGTAALVTMLIGSVINGANGSDENFEYGQVIETPVDASENVSLPEN